MGAREFIRETVHRIHRTRKGTAGIVAATLIGTVTTTAAIVTSSQKVWDWFVETKFPNLTILTTEALGTDSEVLLSLRIQNRGEGEAKNCEVWLRENEY